MSTLFPPNTTSRKLYAKQRYNHNNITNTDIENLHTVNTNTNEWYIRPGNGNRYVPKNIRLGKNSRSKTFSTRHPTVIKLQLNDKSLKLTINETSDVYTLVIGGRDLQCVDCTIYKPKSTLVKRMGYESNVAILSNIYYNAKCSLEGKHQHGEDTMYILHALCEYIRRNYKHVDTVSLLDNSFITCANGYDIELSEMTYILTGKTWYEQNYGAYLADKDIPEFREMEESFQMLKKWVDWDLMKEYIRDDPSRYPIPEKEMQAMFETATTWQEFFGPLSEKIGMSKFCIFMSPWMHKFFSILTSSYTFASATYYILLANVPSIEYKSMEYKRGGKLTRKHRTTVTRRSATKRN